MYYYFIKKYIVFALLLAISAFLLVTHNLPIKAVDDNIITNIAQAEFQKDGQQVTVSSNTVEITISQVNNAVDSVTSKVAQINNNDTTVLEQINNSDNPQASTPDTSQIDIPSPPATDTSVPNDNQENNTESNQKEVAINTTNGNQNTETQKPSPNQIASKKQTLNTPTHSEKNLPLLLWVLSPIVLAGSVITFLLIRLKRIKY